MSQPADAEETTDFFLPDLCQANSILFLVLVTELLVLVLVLYGSAASGFNWAELGLTSLFVQWLVLSSAALLCNIRPWLMQLSVGKATAIAYSLILVITLIFSFGAEWVVSGEFIVAESLTRIGRNLVIAVIMTGIAFRYFFLAHQLRVREQAELTARIQALQSRIRPHFLFNSMNIIASLIAVDPDLAEEVVEDLSVLFRASLNEATSEPVRLEEPFIGLTSPAASPTAIQPGPERFTTDIGNRHARAFPMSAPRLHEPSTVARYDASNLLRLRLLKPFIVDKAPTPIFTEPSPHGNIQPYPGTGVPCSSRSVRHASNMSSACLGDST